MLLAHILLALHLLGAAVWVGGMFFALLVLRPSLSVLEPPQRLALHAQVFRRFFRVVWHVMPLMLISGVAMVPAGYGFATRSTAVQVMALFGLIMSAVFVGIYFGPWKRLRDALAEGDTAGGAVSVGRIRGWIMANLILGLATVAIAAFAE